MSALKPSSPFVTAPEKLAQHIGITFASPELLEMALRHRSAGNMNNERLEFLGDAVLNLVIANQLYTMHSKATEGELSRWRASLVREESLAVIARELDLGSYLVLGPGELKSGGFRRDSILADALEATIGAVYLDQGFDVAQSLLVRLFERMLQDLPDAASLKDPKTRLQEWLQGSKRELPSYEVTTIRGQAHKQVFEVTCTLSDTQQTAVGRGSSRRKAEQAAAESMFEALSKTQQKPTGLGH
ncbi:ribonuclease III [Halothiobacillus neapolitanus]|uniref:Ribonuclease 3 n=1 Tax=Halothiobacillus neapolitanus (strain ATCC 23641 / DSM 15147 / CIP 104769 / NCIMB 8539 / c2) TaxID=555778 RepID=D0L0J9_HALNC|nr:ribonuclease III [Halothiobacillus neapolitanus]ACX96222.1 ribonuclease III [Halothiobacillus neapolitanus c2]